MAKRKRERVNPRRVPRSEADCRQEWKAGVIEGLRLMECILLRVMIDKHPDALDLEKLWQELPDYSTAWADGKVTSADLRDSLRQEDEILLMGGPSRAIARGGGSK